MKQDDFSKHEIFLNLQKYIDFYESLSELIMWYPTIGTQYIVSIDTFFYTSIRGTLDTLKFALQNKRVGDAYTLLRKYHDISILNLRIILYLKEHSDILNARDGNELNAIYKWVHEQQNIGDLSKFSKAMSYIESRNDLNPLTQILKDDRYQKIRDRCNDYLHHNLFDTILKNSHVADRENQLKDFNQINNDIRDIFIFHLSYIFFINEHYMMSSDYSDYMEFGEQPPENAQYWVANFILSIFDEVINKYRPDVGALLKASTVMYLDKNHPVYS